MVYCNFKIPDIQLFKYLEFKKNFKILKKILYEVHFQNIDFSFN